MLDGKQLASGEKPQDFASDEEAAAYWLGFCRDAIGRAKDKRAAQRKAKMWQNPVAP